MSENDHRDEHTELAILAALEVLEADREPSAEETRPWVELLGLLPGELEPEAPRPAVKEQLMDQVREQAGDAHVQAFERPVTDQRPNRASTHWVFKLAAVLALVLLGVSAKQAIDLAEGNRRLDRQAVQIAELKEALDGFEPTAGAPEWMAASGTELCALRPQLAGEQESKGWLFVRADHQHWYVAVEGLEPSPDGHVYELWFISDGQPVSGGTFVPGPDGRVSLTSESMPGGITGIAITLEPDNGDGTPSDTTVLYGDEVMLTL